MQPKVKIAALTCELPKTKFANDHPIFSTIERISDRWWRFWGTEKRGYFDLTQGESELSAAEVACKRILEKMNLKASDIDVLICSSSNPILNDAGGVLAHDASRIHPRLSHILKKRMQFDNALSFDTQVECSAFMLNINIAASYLKQGLAKHVLVVCSEMISTMLDHTAETSTIFADGCAVALLTHSEADEPYDLLSAIQHSNAEFYEAAVGCWRRKKTDVACKEPLQLFFTMYEKSQAVMQEFVPTSVPRVVAKALAAASLKTDEIDFFVFHQPSPLLVHAWATGVGCPEEKYSLTAKETGVMVSVALPYTLYCALEDKKISKNQHIVLAGAGTGWSFLAQVWHVGDIVIC